MVTAVLNVLNQDKHPIRCRALIDTASTSNFITENLANILRIPKQKYSIPIEGLGEIQTSTSHLVTATLQSRYNKYEKTLSFLTVPVITRLHPSQSIDRGSIKIPPHVQLADPTFHIPSRIDMLIGAGPALSMFCIGQLNLSSPQGTDLFLQKTRLGWVIGGAVSIHTNQGRNKESSRTECHVSTTQALAQLSRLWEIEEGPRTKHLSQEETDCEAHFAKHVRRGEDGRYIVALPFNSKGDLLGESRAQAESRLRSLEKRFIKDPQLKQQYTAVIQEYLDLGHMEQVEDCRHNSSGFYLPHHAVIKESSLTTKLRVVFDGSARSTSGVSLNDALMVGPTIQDDILTHLIRFRFHTHVLTGDIEKMYRQTWIRPEDRKYQRILWKDEAGTINTYELKTVTFGLASAPSIVKRDIYVDDLLTGARSYEEALEARNQLIQLLQRGSLNLRQWASNDPRLLKGLPEANINAKLQLDGDSTLKTLGIHWQSHRDVITYTVKSIPTKATMRVILSEIAKIFDPLGLLGPITIAGRLILQDCWRHRVAWDESLPSSIHTDWITFSQEFNKIQEVSISRGVIPCDVRDVQIHGFCDASEKAYGVCLYVRSTTTSGMTQSKILCSKVKVAPLKTVSLARLELCAALMLARLYEAVREHIHWKIDKTTFWSDSTIVLHWINTEPHRLKTFAANRISEIQTKTTATDWRHVRSEDNPADALSRGQLPSEFVKNALWRDGPTWLAEGEDTWHSIQILPPKEDVEKRKLVCLTTHLATPQEGQDDILHKFSSITRLQRVIAYCLRFKRNKGCTGPLQIDEIKQAELRIIKLIQATSFVQEIRSLQHKEEIHNTSKLKCLSPYLDDHGILRVRGRLIHAEIPLSQQQPIILPKSHHVTQLIIKEEHEKHFHAGAQSTLYAWRKKYWLINGRNEVRRVLRQCVKCIRLNQETAEYPMGDLPKARVSQSPRPFYNVGVDYCGPFYIKEKRHRNRNKIKTYVAVFVCLATKAVHLEIVSDLTTEGFIAALKRFVARRGKCHTISSDNGTNFVGTNNQLKKIYAQIHSQDHQEKVQRHLTGQGIIWKFIPARSPHFGGLWEAAVKSYKHHMRRVIGDSLLTFEDFNTFVIEIEAILNSRPLTPLSSDPSDPIALTPGHFIIGDSLTNVPELDLTDTPSNRLSSWQQVQKYKQSFWRRWNKEYINGLNIRSKWIKGIHNINEGSIVVIKDDDTRPLHWKLGRVIKTHVGGDGVIRTVTIKTESGIIDRNVRKLAPLLPKDDRTH